MGVIWNAILFDTDVFPARAEIKPTRKMPYIYCGTVGRFQERQIGRVALPSQQSLFSHAASNTVGEKISASFHNSLSPCRHSIEAND